MLNRFCSYLLELSLHTIFDSQLHPNEQLQLMPSSVPFGSTKLQSLLVFVSLSDSLLRKNPCYQLPLKLVVWPTE